MHYFYLLFLCLIFILSKRYLLFKTVNVGCPSTQGICVIIIKVFPELRCPDNIVCVTAFRRYRNPIVL